jgi:hypothetical protein
MPHTTLKKTSISLEMLSKRIEMLTKASIPLKISLKIQKKSRAAIAALLQ